jgi:hypothetical protein
MSLSPNLLNKDKGKINTVFLIRRQIRSVDDIMEEDTDLQGNFL